MSNRFHSKYHRLNHHTCTSDINADAGHDPIASPDSPFLGDFHLKGALSAHNSSNTFGACFYGSDTGLVTRGGNYAIKGIGNACIVGNLIVTGSINSNSVQTSAGTVAAPVTYCFNNGLTESVGSQFNTVNLNIDNKTIVLDCNQQLAVSYNTFYDSLCSLSLAPTSGVKIEMYGNVNYYNFCNGLQSSLVCSAGGTSTFTVSAKIDNSSIVYNEQGALSVASVYSYGNGLSSNTNNKTVNAYVDNCTIKINNFGQIAGNYCFSGINSGLISNSSSNSVSANVDGISTQIRDGKIVSGYTIGSSSGLVCSPGTSVSLPSLAVKVDNSTIAINESTGQLETLNLLKTNLPSSQNQTINGNLFFSGSVSANRIVFNDGTVLSTSFTSKPTVTTLATHSANLQTGVVVTSDNRILAWGSNTHLAPGAGRTRVWPPIALPFADNYLLKALSTNIRVLEVIHTAHVTLALLSDGTVWAMGFNTLGMLGTNITYPDPKTNAPIHFAKLFSFNKVLIPNNARISKIYACSSYNETYKRVEAAFGAISTTGRAYVWGFNYRNMFGAQDYTPTLYPTVVTTPVTPQGESGPFTSDVKQIYFSFESYPSTINTFNAASNTLPFWKGSCHILKNNGTLFAAGLNDSDQLGVGPNAVGVGWEREVRAFIPCKDGNTNSSNLDVSDVIEIVNGNHYHWGTTFVRTSANQVRVAGINTGSWALGSLSAANVALNPPLLTKTSVYNSFVTIPNLNNVLEFKVSGGGGVASADQPTATFLARTTDGLYGWGGNNAGQLGGSFNIKTGNAAQPINLIKTPTKIAQFGTNTTLGMPSKIIPSRVVNNSLGFLLTGIITTDGYLHIAGYRNPVQYEDFIDLRSPSLFRTVPIRNVINAEFCANSTGDYIMGVLIQDVYSRIFLYCLEPNSPFSGGSADAVYPPTDFSNYLS